MLNLQKDHQQQIYILEGKVTAAYSEPPASAYVCFDWLHMLQNQQLLRHACTHLSMLLVEDLT